MARDKRKIYTGQQARIFILKGIERLADAVKATLGYAGRHVIIEDLESDYAKVSRDGVEVAQSITFGDNRLEMGAKLAKDAARQSWVEAGDGTTTTIVLTEAICKSVHNILEEDYNPNLIAKGIRLAAVDAIQAVTDIAIPVTEQSLIDVATVSANNDEELGRLVADIVWKVGSNGSVSLKEGKEKTTVDIQEGTVMMSGWLTPEFVNVPQSATRIEANPFICVTDFVFQKTSEVIDVLTMITSKELDGMPCVLIAKEFIGEARSFFVRAFVEKKVPIL
jgi:chaperonin GroEL